MCSDEVNYPYHGDRFAIHTYIKSVPRYQYKVICNKKKKRKKEREPEKRRHIEVLWI